LQLNAHGLRCIAYDRRGHGRSERPGKGYDYDRLADDVAELIEHLQLRDITMITHSMGAGECTRYLSRYGSARVQRAAFVGTIAPCYRHSASYPQGLPLETLDAASRDALDDIPLWLEKNAEGFYLPQSTGTCATMTRWTMDCMLAASPKALAECSGTRVRADLREEMRAIDVPVLVIHGDRDQSEPGHGKLVAELVPQSRYVEYAGAPHGIFHTHRHRLIEDIVAFMGVGESAPRETA
jgi:non-heme chloroperoxidase